VTLRFASEPRIKNCLRFARALAVPRISAFYGIVIAIYYYDDQPPPHFHAINNLERRP
jgi:hypothetical protein